MRLTSLLTLPAISIVAQAAVIVPGATWTDTSGTVIQAHGGGFLKVFGSTYQSLQRSETAQVGSTFYWFGEDKAANSALFSAVSCYTVGSNGFREFWMSSFYCVVD
jgi:hypothetical protein